MQLPITDRGGRERGRSVKSDRLAQGPFTSWVSRAGPLASLSQVPGPQAEDRKSTL